MFSIKIIIMENFYKEKKLAEFSEEEWERLCMNCGKCCMNKYSDRKEIHFFDQMCRYYDLKKGCCSRYDTRLSTGVCAKVNMKLLKNNIELLPDTCPYRLLYEGKDLPDYHPLITGNPNSPIEAGATVKSLPVYSEQDKSDALYMLHIRADAENWDEVKFLEEEMKIFNQFEPKIIFSFPIKKNLIKKLLF